MLLAVDDLADDDAIERSADRLDAFDLEAGHRQALHERIAVGLDVDELAEPVFGKFHALFPSFQANCFRKRKSFSKNWRKSLTP